MSRVRLQDSINPKPLSEGIVEEHPRQLAPSVGTLSAQGRASAVPVTSAAFVLESPTPQGPKDPIYCGPFEFAPHLKPSHPTPSESSDDMTTTFGGVHFIIDSGGFLRLPRTDTSGLGPSVSTEDTRAATLEIPPRSMHGGNRGSLDHATGRKKRRRESYYGEREQEGMQSIHGRARSPHLSATEQLDAPCYLHSYIDPKDGREKSSHLLRNCRHFLEIRQFDDLRSEAMSRAHIMEKKARSYSYRAEPYIPEPYEPMEKDEYVPAEVFLEPRGQVSMIHKTSFSKREIKKFSREVKYAEVAMVDTPEFIDWSEQSISFDRSDHPKAVPRPGHAALVLEAQIGGYNMSKVFMDGASGLNLLFANTMKAMGLTVDMLRESDTGFHGIIPTRRAYSLGKTSLDVVFGTPTNFRREKIEFEVVDWESQYHAIGRPAFAKEFQKIASKFGAKEELNAIDAAVDHTQPPADNRNEGALIEFLRERWEIFAWEPSDMPIPGNSLSTPLMIHPRAQGIEWVANPVMVPKKDTTALRMCIDYTGLNKHCPKDHFPLPRIDQIVDSTAGCDRLSFLDAYSGYNQIKLKKEDQELTAFITPHGAHNVMTFGLKNAGATYQRCMQACLGEQIGRNIEVYIDDIVVKTKHTATLVDDLRETFDNLDRLSRFIAKLGEKALPFYNLMKKSEKFEWTKEAQESFDNLKKILSTSPVLVTPREKETLLMYIAATAQVFSSVLVVEREEAGRVHGRGPFTTSVKYSHLQDKVSDNMIAYRQLYQNMEAKFEGCELKHIGRASNEEADTLANIGSMCSPIPDGVFYEVITQRSIKEKALAPPKPTAEEAEANPQQAADETPTPAEQVLILEPLWTKPFLAYLTKQELPADSVEAKRIVRRSKAFTIVNGELYKRSISGIFQRCIAIDDGRALLREIHEGTCGHHAGSRALVEKAFRAGFYWPTAASDAGDLVMKSTQYTPFFWYMEPKQSYQLMFDSKHLE
ncbi:hypothetical protein QYE76_061315 [Lolium multiflorum]|uniref:Reverse transcriptase domain-containing protein n=1 Tax=Lolium multiflorum TaxID=4521 RepID=A0AAD8S1M9_LOLMU|nr:hypothetical protein QYE76_061315 [Lolium multiflorum]